MNQIEFELTRWLDTTIWGKVGQKEVRAKQLMSIHRKYIELAVKVLTVSEIAKSLYKYEVNNLKTTIL